jgi:hypothetical protein
MSVMGIVRRTSAEWATNSTALSRYEIGVESDTGQMKVGDGVSRWTDLSYVAGGGALIDLTDGPDALVAKGVLCGNDAGTRTRMSDVIQIDEAGGITIVQDGDNGIGLVNNGDNSIEIVNHADDQAVNIAADGEGGSVGINAQGGGAAISASHDGRVNITAAGTAGVRIKSTQQSGAGSSGGVELKDEGDWGLSLDTSASTGPLAIAVGAAGASITGLPTADPHVAGALWVSTGALKVSAG